MPKDALPTRSELAIAETVGPNTPAVAAALNNLASFYDLQGRLSEAEPLKKQVVTARRDDLRCREPGGRQGAQ